MTILYHTILSPRVEIPKSVVSIESVELQRQFLALRRAGALPLQTCLERRGLGSCALPTHRELPFVYNWGVRSTPLFYQIKSLCNCASAAPEPLVPQSKSSTSQLRLIVLNLPSVLTAMPTGTSLPTAFRSGPPGRVICRLLGLLLLSIGSYLGTICCSPCSLCSLCNHDSSALSSASLTTT